MKQFPFRLLMHKNENTFETKVNDRNSAVNCEALINGVPVKISSHCVTWLLCLSDSIETTCTYKV